MPRAPQWLQTARCAINVILQMTRARGGEAQGEGCSGGEPLQNGGGMRERTGATRTPAVATAASGSIRSMKHLESNADHCCNPDGFKHRRNIILQASG